MTRHQRTHRYPRTARVNEVVLEVLAEELDRLSDPRLGFVTLTGVEVSPDLHHAAVYYSVLGHGKKAKTQPAETAEALESAGPHLRAVLGRQVRLKYTPELHFRKDPAIMAGQRVEEIIRSLRDEESSGE
jgi:ribosome-binding factor A